MSESRCSRCADRFTQGETCPYEDVFRGRTNFQELVDSCEHFKPLDGITEEKKTNIVQLIKEHEGEIVQAAVEYNDYPFDEFLPLWNKIIAFLKQHVEFRDEKTYEICAAWVFANWIPEVWETYPYLYFYGIHESGKNQAWQTLAKISYKSVECANISGAGIFRSVRPEIMEDKVINTRNGVQGIKVPTGNFDYATFFMDELGVIMGQSSENEQEKHQILNAGYKKNGSVIRCVGKNFVPKSFPVDGFKSISSVYMVPDALKSRCITIRMVRSEQRFPLRYDKNEVQDIISGLTTWRLNAYEQRWVKNTKSVSHMYMNLAFDTVFIEELLFEYSGGNGRLMQLFYPLYRVAPLSRKGIILEALKEEGKQKVQSSLASFQADIFSAVLEVYNKFQYAYVLFTTDILNAYNDEHSDAPIKIRTLQREVESLGFKPYRTAKKKGFRVEKGLIERLKQRFKFDAVSAESAVSVGKGIMDYLTQQPNTPSSVETAETAQPTQQSQQQQIEQDD